MNLLDIIMPSRSAARKQQLEYERTMAVEKAKYQNMILQQRAILAAQVNRLTEDWITLAQSINYDIKQGGSILRTRARDIAINDPITKRALSIISKNVVGPDGFNFRAKVYEWVKDKDGNYEQKFDVIANQKIQNAFKKWQGVKYCTVTEEFSFDEFQRLLIKTIATDGEVFLLKIKGKGANSFGFAFQVLDADLFDEKYSKRLPNGNYVEMSIEYTSYGKPVAYYMKKVLPENEIYGYNYATEYVRIPAENIMHLFIKERFGQRRGITWLAPVAIRLKMLDAISEASLVHMRAAACTTGILTPKDDTGTGEFKGEKKDAFGNARREIAPAEMFVVPDNYNFNQYDPKFPTDQYAPFVKQMLMDIASGLDLSYIVLANNYEGVNYSSGRLSLLDDRDTWKIIQAWMINHFLLPFYPEWLEMALLSTELKLPIERFDKFNEVWFYGRRWDWTDPEKDVKAKVLAISNNLETLEDALAERGMDLEETLAQRAYEIKLLKKYGLTIQDVIPAAPKENNTKETENDKES